MKSIGEIGLCAVLAAFANMVALADTETVDGVTWTYTVSNGEVSLGGGSFDCTAVPTSTSGDITIPSSLGGYPVTSIGDSAFYWCSSLASVTIPDSVTSIGVYAFFSCSGLTDLTIGNSVTNIGTWAFASCDSLASVIIPNGVTSIGDCLFYECRGLVSVTIPDGVTSIGSYAFCNCIGLNGITIPDGVASIGDGAFVGCIGLADEDGFFIVRNVICAYGGTGGDVVIPDGVTEIGYGAFAFCSELTNVTIPNSVTSIGDGAFYECSGLIGVTIPNSVKRIGFHAFYGCESMISVTIPDGVTEIGDEAFALCSGLTNVTIPDGVMEILNGTFVGCSGLTSVTIPSSVTNIGYAAFQGCSGLISVTIPDSVTSIGYYAFSDCSGLTSVTIPNSVTNIGYYAFSDCSGLLSVRFENVETLWRLRSGIDKYLPIGVPVIVDNLPDGIQVHCGAILNNEIWSGGKVHLVVGNVAVDGGASLLIESGAVVKFMPDTGLSIDSNACCQASGAIFTHVNDDTIGGDTLMDGGATAPVMDDYKVPNMLTWDDTIEFRYRSDPNVTLSGTISSDETWRGHNVYCVTGNLTVASGATLTIMSGSIVKFAEGLSLTVNGNLDARGSRAEPIVFTSTKDDEFGGDTNGDGDKTYPYAGDWSKISINGGTANFNYAKILYSSKNATTGAINMTSSGGRVVFANGEIAHAAYDAIGVESGNCHVTNSVIHDCLLAFRHWTRDPIVNCVIYDCGRLTQGGGQHFYNCIFSHIIETWEAFGFPQNGTTYRNCCFWNENGSVLTAEGRQDAKTVCGKNGNIWANPRFLDPENGDFRIADNSPCINAGDSSVAPEFDYYGQPRDGVADIGIYEVLGAYTTGYDLSAVAVNAQAARSTIGETFAISYDIANVGRLAVPDQWHDALYLVSVSSGKMYALGEPLNPGALGAGDTRTFTLQFKMPVVPVGSYRLRLVVNSRRMDVPEGAATENNVVLSDAEIEVVADSIDASDGASGNVAAGASSVCAFSIPEGAGDKLLRIKSVAGGTTLSARCGLVFLPVDATSGTALSFSGGEAWLSVPAGTEKVWLVLDNDGASAASYEVDFHDGSLALLGVSPSNIPSSGDVTLEISGAGFTDGCEVSFVGAGTVAPLAVRRVSSGLIVATVNAASFVAGGQYAVTVTKESEAKTLESALTVAKAAGKPKFWAKLDVPDSMRQGRLVQTCFVEYGNSGTADMPSPVLQVSMTGDGTLGYIGGLSGLKTLQFVAAGDAGSAGILRAGSSHRIRFEIRAGASNKISLHTSEGSTYAPAPWTNAADYLSDLSTAATRIGLRGQDATDYVMVFDLAKAVKNGEPSSAIYGRVVDENGEGMYGTKVSLYDSSSNLVSCVSADASGRFVSDAIASGSYWLEMVGIPLSEVDSSFDVHGGEDVIAGELHCTSSPSIRVIFENVSAGKRIDVALTSFDGLESIRPYWESDNVARFYGADGNTWMLSGKTDDLVCFATVSPSDGETVELSCVMEVGCEINGRVDSAATTGATGVILVGENGLYRFMGIDDNGLFAITDLPAGEYTVAVLGVAAGDYEVVSELVLTAGDTVSLTFTSQAMRSTSVASSSVKLRGIKAVKFAKSWTWPWNLRSTLLDYIRQMERRIEATEMSVVEPDPDCEHNLAKYKRDKDVLDKMRTQLSAMKALYDETDRSYSEGVWDNLGKSALNLGSVLAKLKLMKMGKLNTWTDEAIDLCNDYTTELIDGKTVFAALKETAIKEILPVDLSIDALFNLPARAKSVWDRRDVWADLFIVWEGNGDEKMDNIIKWEEDVVSIFEDIGKARQLLDRLGLAILADNNPAAFQAELKKRISNLKTPVKEIEVYLGMVVPVLKTHVHFLKAIRNAENGAAALGAAHGKIRANLDWYERNMPIFDDRAKSFGAYHNPCPGAEEPSLDTPPVDNKKPSVPKSCDPNEMVGDEGVGEARYVKPGDWMNYTIYFENKAGFDIADAQEVKVTNPLNEWLDWSTFEMREVAFNNQNDVKLDGLANGMSEVQMIGTNKYVRTTVECDAQNGVATWYMRVYDPNGDTEGFPKDGSGFLPSNDDTHRGEGYIKYRIKVREDAPANVIITNSASIVFDYNDPIETDPAWWNTVSPVEARLAAGEYFYATLTELGYDVPTDGAPYSVVAKGLPAGLKLKYNAAVKDKKGKVVKKAKSEWWIEGVPTAKLDFFENPPYLVITVGSQTTMAPLPIQVAEQEVVELGDLELGQSINTNGWLTGVGAGWAVSGLPTGLKYATKKVTKTTGSGKKKVTTTVAEAYAVYGKTTKAGLFTIIAKKKAGAFYETKKFRVLVRPAAVNASLFGEDLTNITTMAYAPINWDLTGGVQSVPPVPFVPSSIGGNLAKVTGLPTGLTFAAKDAYAYTNAKKKGKYLKQKGQTIVGTPTKTGTYVVTFTKNVKSGKKTVARTAQILWVVTQNDAELSLGFNNIGGVIESGVVGLKYADMMAFAATSNATVTASGLPAGIKLVKLDDGHAGRVPLPGFATWGFQGYTAKAGTYLVTVKATLNGKTITQRVALKVDALPAWAKGTFNGYVAGEDGATNGLATVTVSAAGKVSGKFYDRGTNWTFTAASYTAAVPGTRDACPYQEFSCSNVVAKFAYKVTEKVKGKKKTVTKYVTRSFTLTVAESGTRDACPYRGVATLEEVGGGSTVRGWQNLWGSTYKALGKKLFSSKSGKKTLAYRTFVIKSTDPAGAEMGLTEAMTLSLKVTTAGAVTATMSFDTGKKSKGKAVIYKATCSTVVIPLTEPTATEFKGFSCLYFAPSMKNNFLGFAAAVPF